MPNYTVCGNFELDILTKIINSNNDILEIIELFRGDYDKLMTQVCNLDSYVRQPAAYGWSVGLSKQVK